MGTHRVPSRKRQYAAAAVGLAVGLLVAYLVTRTGTHAHVPHVAAQVPGWHHYVRPPAHHTVALHAYTVRTGDCLWTIGRDHGVPWRTLAVANHIRTPYLIHPGQVLIWR